MKNELFKNITSSTIISCFVSLTILSPFIYHSFKTRQESRKMIEEFIANREQLSETSEMQAIQKANQIKNGIYFQDFLSSIKSALLTWQIG